MSVSNLLSMSFGGGSKGWDRQNRTTNTTKPIECLKPFDVILVRDPKSGNTTGQQVVHILSRHITGTLVLEFSNGEKVETTRRHPFYVVGFGFKHASQLTIGESCLTLNGKHVQVIRIESNPDKKCMVYN